MTTKRPHPDGGPLSEDSLLALIEGGLDDAAEQRVLAALASRPDLLATARAMRRDRALLAELCDVEAPPEVASAIEGAIERAALLDAPAAFDDLPPAPISINRARRSNRWPGVLAAAAAVALLAGGVGFWALSRGGSTPVGPIALNEAPADATVREPAPESRTRIASAEPDRPGAMTDPGANAAALEQPAAESDTATLLANADESPVQEIEPAPATVLAAAAEVIPARVDSIERALELASQGRLAVRVRADALGRAIGGMDAMASGESGRTWRLSCPLPPGHVSAGAGMAELARRDAARAEREAMERTIASESSIGALRKLESMGERVRESHPYFASLALTPESLTALRNAIEDRTDSSVTFEELAGPARPELDLRETEPLWWDEPPSRWVPWADVLVVVEG